MGFYFQGMICLFDRSEKMKNKFSVSAFIIFLGIALEIWLLASESLLALIFVVLYMMGCTFIIVSKCGAENPIWQLVPVANIIHLLWCADLPWWLCFLMLIPVLNMFTIPVILTIAYCKIAVQLNRPWWVGICILFPVLNVFLLGYLASSDL